MISPKSYFSTQAVEALPFSYSRERKQRVRRLHHSFTHYTCVDETEITRYAQTAFCLFINFRKWVPKYVADVENPTTWP